MSFAFRLFVILMLALTSQGLSSARGQARAVSELVICAGATITTVTVDADGKPVRRSDFCPDMASQLLAAVALDAPMPTHRLAGAWAVLARVDVAATGRDAPNAQARDPPPRLG